MLPGRGLAPCRVVVEDGVIAAVEPTDAMDAGCAGDTLLLPGIVDLHGDAFEREIMPRPGVRIPVPLAIEAADRSLAACGITTAFHGITCSWEGGVRGRDVARELIDEIRMRTVRAVEHRVHLRFEVFSLDLVDEVCAWIEAGDVDLLAYNDHLSAMLEDSVNPARLSRLATRAGLPPDEYLARLREVAGRDAEVPAARLRLSAAASKQCIPSMSHDDATESDCDASLALGCTAAEFPLHRETAMHAHKLKMRTVFGAPNVLRGGSHIGNASAADMARDGLCDVLASDYYYPALLAAPFRMAAGGVLPFEAAWRLVSANAAQAAGLTDRGEIRVGQRADLILVDASRVPRVKEVIVMGDTRLRLG